MDTNNKEIAVIIPCYNEEAVINEVINNVLALGFTVIAVDDGSSDQTWARLLETETIVLHHSVNLGQGAALQTGISFAVQKTKSRAIVTFDSDGQHHSEDIPRLVKALDTWACDVILGSRFLLPNSTINMPASRRLTLVLATWFTRILTGLSLTDTHNGFRVFTRNAAMKINLTQNRMAHASEILQQIKALNLSYHEEPVTIIYTDYSKKKGQNFLNSINILWDLFFSKR